jgi:hypothetical protein
VLVGQLEVRCGVAGLNRHIVNPSSPSLWPDASLPPHATADHGTPDV